MIVNFLPDYTLFQVIYQILPSQIQRYKTVIARQSQSNLTRGVIPSEARNLFEIATGFALATTFLVGFPRTLRALAMTNKIILHYSMAKFGKLFVLRIIWVAHARHGS